MIEYGFSKRFECCVELAPKTMTVVAECRITPLVIIMARTNRRCRWFRSIKCRREYRTTDWPETVHIHPTTIPVT